MSGKKPKYKKWFVCIPLAIRAVVNAVTHGTGITFIQFKIASFTRIYQGSEIHGVQASLIRAIFFQDFNSLTILSVLAIQE
ncbi:MAG: hypothetical protein LBD88_02670 [Candidatus Peribacteria bacterium]|nr:hypothetical protein [Candidatus Peribacteria bacterium]